MKLILSVFLLCFYSGCFGQFYTKDSIAKYHIKQLTITAIEYENSIEVKKRFNEEKFDKNGNTIRYSVFDENKKLRTFSLYEFSIDGLYEKAEHYNSDSTLSSSSVYIRDTIKNMEIHFLIKKGDTITQKRYYDINGYDSILYTKMGKTAAFEITGQWNYDASGNLLTDDYAHVNISGKMKYINDSINNCVTEYNENNKIVSKTCKKPGEVIDYFYYDSVGYAYGIALKCTKGGTSIRRYNEIGIEKEIVYEDRKGKLLSKVVFEYQK